jgi:hypothetical protein
MYLYLKDLHLFPYDFSNVATVRKVPCETSFKQYISLYMERIDKCTHL